MLDAIEVRGFQSLADARIELGWLTVVEGPSNSGKSALVRALVMLARNARGTDYITTGKATCTVATGSAEEGFAVRLTRTARRGGDEYRVKVAEVPAAKVFTKLAGGVPEEVSALLRISELNIARQFDPPYLLTESGRDVAAVLGRLTNVSMVLAAAAEAGRRRKQLARDLKGAEQRRDDLLEQAQEFAGLAARRRALGRAEKALEALEATVASADRLRDLIGRVAGAEAAVEAARSAAARAEPPSSPMPMRLPSSTTARPSPVTT